MHKAHGDVICGGHEEAIREVLRQCNPDGRRRSISTTTDDLKLTNDGALVQLYGKNPDLRRFRLRSINLDWRGPTVTLRLDLSSFPETILPEWKGTEVDTVQCHLRFLAVENLSMPEWEPPIPSALLETQSLEEERRVRVRVTGDGVALGFTSSESVQVGHVSAFKISADGTDKTRHLFFKRIDAVRYSSIPATEEKTFYGRI
ncbi:Imm50 family immunity protein [Streptomyces sp. NPDC013953]|uniref:Imm50 family immunity protein n=1 Tax=Streptomyces sp. NPDC013953 TaxID=3364868 RepID=UPI00370366F5